MSECLTRSDFLKLKYGDMNKVATVIKNSISNCDDCDLIYREDVFENYEDFRSCYQNIHVAEKAKKNIGG